MAMDRAERLFQIFQEAAESERQARARYEEAASLCADGELKDLLLTFAEDEARHEREVVQRFREMAGRFGGGLH
jgi:rubrerythrin